MASNWELKVAIVGFGWFGKQHFHAWQAVPGVRIVGLCDSRPGAFDVDAKPAQDAFHADVKDIEVSGWYGIPQFASFKEMLSRTDPDIVDVVVPEKDHASIAMDAIANGHSVVIEKPLTTSLADAKALEQAARQVGVRVFPAHLLRFDARYVAAFGTLVEADQRPLHMSLQRHFQTSALEVYGRVDPFFGACVHDIDMAIWLHGCMPDRILGFRNSEPDGIPHTVGGVLEWYGGYTAVVQNSWTLPKGTPAGFIFESTAFLPGRMVQIRNQPIVENIVDDHITWPEFFLWPQVNGQLGGALAAELTHFASCERRGVASPRVPPDQAVKGIATAEMLVKSAHSGTWISLSHGMAA